MIDPLRSLRDYNAWLAEYAKRTDHELTDEDKATLNITPELETAVESVLKRWDNPPITGSADIVQD